MVQNGVYENRRGQKLPYIANVPLNPTCVIVHHHGINEYAERYQALLLDRTAKWNVAAYCCSVHGHGTAEPSDPDLRHHIEHWEDLVDDMVDFIRDIVKPTHGDLPLIMAGNSMGGGIAVHACIRQQPDVQGLILSGAMIMVKRTAVMKVQETFGCCLDACVPKAKMVATVRIEEISQDKEVQATHLNDPMINTEHTRVHTALQLGASMDVLATKYGELSTPVLAYHGSEDKITWEGGVKKLLDSCGTEDKEYHQIQGGYHALLEGPEREEVLRLIYNWLAAKGFINPEGAAE